MVKLVIEIETEIKMKTWDLFLLKHEFQTLFKYEITTQFAHTTTVCIHTNTTQFGYKLRKILKEMGIPDHITCLLRNLYAGQEATVRTGHGTTDWFKIGKGVDQNCMLSPCLFNLNAEYIMWNPRLDEAGINLLGEISTTSDVQMIPF